MATTGGESRRVYDEQMFRLTENLGRASAQFDALSESLNHTNERIKAVNFKLDNICKDCEPVRFVRSAKKLQYLVYATVLANIVTILFTMVAK